MGKKSYYSEENYKTDFKIWMKNSKLQFERKKIERSLPPLDSTPAGAKMSDTKTPEMEYSARKEKAQKDYVSEDPDSDPSLSDSLSRDYDSSGDSNYKRRRRNKNKKYRKLKKQDPIELCAKSTANMLTTAYKPKVLKFKLDEDTLQR